MKCARCGLESEIREAFFKRRRLGWRRFELLCLGCRTKRMARNRFQGLIMTALLGFVGALLVIFAPPSWKFPGWVMLNYFLLLVFVVIAILPHELGHALAARALGLRLFRVEIGSGRTLYEKRIGGSSLHLKTFPYSGLTVALPRSAAWHRLRTWLFIAAGPLANLLLAAFAWPFGSPSGMHDFGSTLYPWHFFLLANLAIVVGNLAPQKVNTFFGKIGSDGLQLLQTPFFSLEKVRVRVMTYYIFEGLEARRLGNHTEAGIWFDRALESAPDNFVALNNVAINRLDVQRAGEARAAFQRILERTDLHPASKALAQNNLAYANLLLGGPELLPEADILSKEALAALPWMAAVKGTRGAVLCELGMLADGIALLTKSMDEATEASSKAENACRIAAAERKRGNLERSEQLWEIAEAMDPRCNLLKRRTSRVP